MSYTHFWYVLILYWKFFKKYFPRVANFLCLWLPTTSLQKNPSQGRGENLTKTQPGTVPSNFWVEAILEMQSDFKRLSYLSDHKCHVSANIIYAGIEEYFLWYFSIKGIIGNKNDVVIDKILWILLALLTLVVWNYRRMIERFTKRK